VVVRMALLSPQGTGIVVIPASRVFRSSKVKVRVLEQPGGSTVVSC
jgi:hypothetical protein